MARKLELSASTVYAHFRRQGKAIPKRRGQPFLEDGPLYASWSKIHARESRRKRGSGEAPMAPAWHDYTTFRTWARRSGYRRGQSLVRLDRAKGWTPENCQFVDREDVVHYYPPRDQGRRPARWEVRAFGESKGPAAWARDLRCTVTMSTVIRRLRDGWRPEDAIADPPAKPGARDHATHIITAFGQTKGVAAWARDRRCRVTIEGLRGRLSRGVPPEEAITTPPWRLGAR